LEHKVMFGLILSRYNRLKSLRKNTIAITFNEHIVFHKVIKGLKNEVRKTLDSIKKVISVIMSRLITYYLKLLRDEYL